MAVAFWDEAWEDSRSGDSDSRRLIYIAVGTEDENEVLDYAEANTPFFHDGMKRGTIQVDAITPDTWRVTANYNRRHPQPSIPEIGSIDFDFDVGLRSEHLRYSLDTVGAFSPSGSAAPDLRRAINVQPDGSVDGVDVEFPTHTFGLSFHPEIAFVTPAYRRLVAQLVGKVNSVDFQGYAAGEVMLVGAQGQVATSEQWEISFRFALRENVEDQSIGEITGIRKDGWDYLWVYYEEEVDAGILVPTPTAVFVERVYDRDDLNQLFGVYAQ